MSANTTASAPASAQPAEITDDTLQAETATDTPVLITTQEVALSTAAASALLAPAKHTYRWILAVRELFARPAEAERRVPKHHPARYAFLEASVMSRAMDRL